MKILVLSKYSIKGASSRFRMMQYFRFLKECGHSITTQELFGDAYLDALYSKKPRFWLVLKSYIRRFFVLLQRPDCDVVWVEKELFPWAPAALDMAILKWIGKAYVLEYDDAVFHSYDLSSNSVVRALLSKKHPILMKNAKVVIAGNSYLAQKAQDSGASKIVQIPTVVSGLKYKPKSLEQPKTVIGWIGSPSTAIYLEKLHDVFKQISNEFNVEFRIVGAKVDWLDLKPTFVPWSENTEISEIQKFDIGVMPLVDSPWEKGKCGFKIVQYMACGKPVVASDVGCNVDIVLENKTGILARSYEDWLAALRKLLRNPELRNAYGQEGRRRFEEKFSLEINSVQVLHALEEAAK